MFLSFILIRSKEKLKNPEEWVSMATFSRVFLAGYFIAVVAFLSSCSSGKSNVEQGNVDGILHYGNGIEPQTIDPHTATGLPEHHIIQALFEGLVVKNPYSMELEPGVAESWSVSQDGLTYTFKIRKDAKWSNGDPLTSEDFRWSWWRALQPALGSQYVFMFFPIKNAEDYFNQKITDFSKVGIKTPDSSTFIVELRNPTPYFMQLLDHYSMFPVHRKTIEKHGEADESYTQWIRPENIVTNGIFKLDYWRLNKKIEVSRNVHYWDHDKVKLNGIVFHPTENNTTEERMFRANQLHFTATIPLERVPVYRKDNPDVLHVSPMMATYFYRLNLKNPSLSDVRVRQALSISVNRDQLTQKVLNNLNLPAYAIVPPGLLGYQPPKMFDYSPDKARQLLADAGYPNGEGFPTLTLQYNTSDQHRIIAIAIQQMWKDELNINVELINKDWKVYLDDERNGNFDISRASWVGDYLDPNTFLDMWVEGAGVNRTGWNNPRYDELILHDAPKQQGQDRFKKFYEAESILFTEMPIIPLYIYSSRHLIHPSVKGMPHNLMDYHNYKYIELVNHEL